MDMTDTKVERQIVGRFATVLGGKATTVTVWSDGTAEPTGDKPFKLSAERLAKYVGYAEAGLSLD